MRKRLLTLILVGVLGFVPTVTMFSPPNIVYAADESELEELSKYIKFGNASENSFFINEVKKDLVVVAYDGESYYQLSAKAYKLDDEIISPYFEFTDDKNLNCSEVEISKYIKDGKIQKLPSKAFNDNEFISRDVCSKLSNSIQKYLFFSTDGVLISKLTSDEINEFATKSYEDPTLDISVNVNNWDISGVHVDLTYSLGLSDDVVNTLYIYNSNNELVDSKILDSENQKDTIDVFFRAEKTDDYTFKVESGMGAIAEVSVNIDVDKLKDLEQQEKQKLSNSLKFKYDKTKPKVKFSGTDNKLAEGETLVITMTTNIETQMSFNFCSKGDYTKSSTFEVKKNGVYTYSAISKSGIETTGVLEIDCFRPENEIYKDFDSPINSVSVDNKSKVTGLPSTGAVATGIIVAGIGAGTGFILIRNGIKRKEKNNEEE